MFVEKYRRAFQELGLALSAEDGISEPAKRVVRGDVGLPPALEDYYALCGSHEINSRHNQLLAPGENYIIDHRLVFMEEQGGFVWGVLLTGSADPEVWQGAKAVGSVRIEWHREDLLFSDFITAMWRWQITGAEPQRDAPE